MGLPESLRLTLCVCSQESESVEEDTAPSHTLETEESEEETRGNESGRLQIQRKPRSQKRDATLKDQQSTGRKRAAREYPFELDGNGLRAKCEWAGKAECGGGPRPILGCVNGRQEARHHGPDKSTSNNDEGNVHRICHRCHNRWHAKNNSAYDWTDTRVKKHAPRDQTPQERELALYDEMLFIAKKEKRVRD